MIPTQRPPTVIRRAISPPRIDLVIIVGLPVIVAVAAALRLTTLGRSDMWIDEAATFALAQRDFLDMVGLFTWEANGIIYQLIAFPLVHIDESLVLLRLPSAVAGVLMVPATYWAGKPLLGRGGALIGAALIAVNPFAIEQSQDARSMAMVGLFAALSFGALARGLAVPEERRWWILYSLALAATFYSNALAGLLVLLPQLLWAAPRGMRIARKLGVALAGTLAILGPLIVLSLIARARWDPFYWVQRPGLDDLRGGLTALFGGGLVVLIALAALAFGLLRSGRRTPRFREMVHHPLVLLSIWALVPPIALFAVSMATPLFQSRYALGALPGAGLLVAGALIRAPRPATAVLAVAALVVCGRTAIDHLADPRDEWEAATAAIVAQRQPGEPVVFDTHSGIGPAGYYDPSFRSPEGLLVIAPWRDVRVPPGITLLDDPDGYGRVATGPPSVELIQRLTAEHGRAMVVLSTVAPTQGDVWQEGGLAWAQDRCTTDRTLVGGVEIVQISRCSAPS